MWLFYKLKGGLSILKIKYMCKRFCSINKDNLESL